MPFRFTLAPVLRLRQSVERQRSLALQNAALQVARAQGTLAQLDLFLSESATVDSASLTTGLTAAEMRFAGLVREQIEQLRAHLREDVLRLEGIRRESAVAYQQAFREREVLESLRTRQRRVYQIEQTRREQRQLDAAYLLQRWHRRDG